ncbi:MAG TPA: hypothetical protein VGY97_02035 [Solirubrobacteraceae bacterium]|jgi:hypothetical protein|nr:hypothetical protein [Solirubrobacteraceae bacterium]
MAGVVHVVWYATALRADKLEAGLREVAPAALRYGATAFEVHRNRDDRYRFLQLSHFERKLDWQRYWDGPEFVDFRARFSSYYQVPLAYVWHDVVVSGALEPEEEDGRAAAAG